MGSNYLSVGNIGTWTRRSDRGRRSFGGQLPFQGDTRLEAGVSLRSAIRPAQSQPGEAAQLSQVSDNVSYDLHLRPTQQPRLKHGRTLHHDPTGQIEPAD